MSQPPAELSTLLFVVGATFIILAYDVAVFYAWGPRATISQLAQRVFRGWPIPYIIYQRENADAPWLDFVGYTVLFAYTLNLISASATTSGTAIGRNTVGGGNTPRSKRSNASVVSGKMSRLTPPAPSFAMRESPRGPTCTRRSITHPMAKATAIAPASIQPLRVESASTMLWIFSGASMLRV